MFEQIVNLKFILNNRVKIALVVAQLMNSLCANVNLICDFIVGLAAIQLNDASKILIVEYYHLD
jgi:hypothetical protein